MIYYYTALVISYMAEPDFYSQSVIWYSRKRHCVEAMRSESVNNLYDDLVELYGNDIMMKCHVSKEVSFVLKPKLRGEK
jgi:hypothetical protein